MDKTKKMEKRKTKVCSGPCGEFKTVSEFHKNKDGKYGVQSVCKACRSIEGKKYREKNPEKCIERNKIYRKNNPEKIREKDRKYRENNKDMLNEKNKKYRENPNNKEKIIAWPKKDREDNPEKWAARDKKNREDNKEYYKEWHKKDREDNKEYHTVRHKKYNADPKNKQKTNERLRNRRATDINYKLTRNLRRRLCQAIKNNYKSASAIKLVGCTIPELKLHIEKQFLSGMTWDNWSPKGWHVDHILPCISFDFSDPEQQKACFHYSNLQPLWAVDNLTKGAKY